MDTHASSYIIIIMIISVSVCAHLARLSFKLHMVIMNVYTIIVNLYALSESKLITIAL